MRYKILALATGAAILLTASVVGDRVIERRTTKIDEDVSLVTLDSIVIVMQRGERPRVTHIRPDVTPPRTMRIAPPVSGAKPTPPVTVRWTLPYSCSDVKWYNAKFSKTQLEAMRVAAGMAKPTQDQLTQIRACLAGKVQ